MIKIIKDTHIPGYITYSFVELIKGKKPKPIITLNKEQFDLFFKTDGGINPFSLGIMVVKKH